MSDIYTKLAIVNVKLQDPVTGQRYLTKIQKLFEYKHPKTIIIVEYFIDNAFQVGYTRFNL